MLKRPTLENAWGHFQVSTATFLFLASHPQPATAGGARSICSTASAPGSSLVPSRPGRTALTNRRACIKTSLSRGPRCLLSLSSFLLPFSHSVPSSPSPSKPQSLNNFKTRSSPSRRPSSPRPAPTPTTRRRIATGRPETAGGALRQQWRSTSLSRARRPASRRSKP